MNLSGSERLSLSRAEAWATLSDPRSLGEALPAVESVEVAGNGFQASFRPMTGLGATPMAVAFEVVEQAEPERLVVTGHGGAAEFAVRLRAAFELVDEEGGTEVRWELELHLHGVLRSLTQRVIEQLARQQVASVLAAVQASSAPIAG